MGLCSVNAQTGGLSFMQHAEVTALSDAKQEIRLPSRICLSV